MEERNWTLKEMEEGALRLFSRRLRELRKERRISCRQLADGAGVAPSVVTRAEQGRDARLSTWGRLFDALGYFLLPEIQENSEEAGDLLQDEAERRERRRLDGLCAGKRRFY